MVTYMEQPPGYADADFARNIDDRISTSGYVFMLSGASISWFSGKQRTVSLSTANAEYIALSEAIVNLFPSY